MVLIFNQLTSVHFVCKKSCCGYFQIVGEDLTVLMVVVKVVVYYLFAAAVIESMTLRPPCTRESKPRFVRPWVTSRF